MSDPDPSTVPPTALDTEGGTTRTIGGMLILEAPYGGSEVGVLRNPSGSVSLIADPQRDDAPSAIIVLDPVQVWWLQSALSDQPPPTLRIEITRGRGGTVSLFKVALLAMMILVWVSLVGSAFGLVSGLVSLF